MHLNKMLNIKLKWIARNQSTFKYTNANTRITLMLTILTLEAIAIG